MDGLSKLAFFECVVLSRTTEASPLGPLFLVLSARIASRATQHTERHATLVLSCSGVRF